MDTLERYINHMQNINQRTQLTVSFHRRVIQRWREYLKAERQTTELEANGMDCLGYMNFREETGGIIPRTLAKELCVLRTYYLYLKETGVITCNPLEALPELICGPIRETAYLTVEECTTVLDHIDTDKKKGLRDYTLFVLLWSTGLRPTELRMLDWGDVDLDSGLLRVLNGKGGKQRQVFLNDHLWEDLKLYHASLGLPTEGPVFTAMATDKQGDRLSASALTDACQALGRNAGIKKKVNPSMLRHTFATHMYEAGVSIEDIQEMLGHVDETETTIYVHITMTAVRQLLTEHPASQNTGEDQA